jgi:hypothetical protein
MPIMLKEATPLERYGHNLTMLAISPLLLTRKQR